MKYLFNTFSIFSILTILLLSGGCAAKKELANLKQDYNATEEKLQQQSQQQQALVAEKNAMQDNNNKLMNENEQLQNKLLAARQSLKEIAAQEPECPEAMTKGVVFKVQIGAYAERNLADDLTASVAIDTEEKGEVQKTVIGQFRNYQKADKLKKQLRAMGVNNAWIVPYKDGKRVPLKEVLSSVEVTN